MPTSAHFVYLKIVFVGFLLKKHGNGPSEEKVKAIVEASQPESPLEVYSSLSPVGFNAMFISDFATTADPLRKIVKKGDPFLFKN